MTDLAEAGHIAVNADIEGWVGQDQIGSLAFEQPGVIFVGAGVPAQQPVRAKDPEIALSRNRRRNDSRNMIFRTGFDRLLLGRIVKDRIDLAQRKAGHLQVVELQIMKTMILDREDVAVPAGEFSDPVIGNDECFFVGLRQRTECDHRHQLQARLMSP